MTDAQWDLMNAVWAAEQATARQLTEDLRPTRGWAYSTVKTQLDRLAAQGLIEARKVGNVWEYRAAMSQDDARQSAWKRFVKVAFGGGAVPALAFAAEQQGLDQDERQALLDLVDRDTPE